MLANLQSNLETRLNKLEITAAMQDVMEIILEVRFARNLPSVRLILCLRPTVYSPSSNRGL